MVKAALMKLVDNVNTAGDCIAEAAGHVVVHLPPYHSQLKSLFGVTSRASWRVQTRRLSSETWSLWFGNASCK
ncbi:hypothetical protein HPB49_004872 [Dermacentor silvarum]|uniref:Uncharacterized protein n=2 Tax=Dermacentor silvarum TaxID=543639 RepID=A0ACB8DUK9_DERSI|nr:hypothetical protein HPB49_004872 [Dermacentor silvarum]